MDNMSAASNTGIVLPEKATARSWYTLAICWFVFLFSTLDRSILAVLVQPIKEELLLSDLQIGLLTGFAFSAFYAIFSLPIARLADRGFRHHVVWVALIVWSLFTASSGLARSFWHLALSRFGVGAAEAGVSPSLQSLVYESFPTSLRNTASAILQSGGATGILLAFALGSLLEAEIGWRMTFAVISIPSIFLAFIFLFTIQNKQVKRPKAKDKEEARDRSFMRLLNNPTFVLLCLASGLQMVLLNGLPQWIPAFIERSYDLPRAQIGGMVAATSSTGMLLGIILGGPTADRLARLSPKWPTRLMLITALIVTLPSILMFAVRDLSIVFPMMAITGFFIAIPAGLLPAAMQHSVRPDQRASAAAGIILTTSLIGTGLAPALTGLISDLYAPAFGDESLRYALLTVVVVDAPLLCWVFYQVHRLQTKALKNSPPGETTAGASGGISSS